LVAQWDYCVRDHMDSWEHDWVLGGCRIHGNDLELRILGLRIGGILCFSHLLLTSVHILIHSTDHMMMCDVIRIIIDVKGLYITTKCALTLFLCAFLLY